MNTRDITFSLIEGFDNLSEDVYEDMMWQGTDRNYIYRGSDVKLEQGDTIGDDKIYFSDSRYDAAGYGQYIIKVKRDLLKITYLRKDPQDEDIPEGVDGIGYPKGICNNYTIYSSSVNNIFEVD